MLTVGGRGADFHWTDQNIVFWIRREESFYPEPSGMQCMLWVKHQALRGRMRMDPGVELRVQVNFQEHFTLTCRRELQKYICTLSFITIAAMPGFHHLLPDWISPAEWHRPVDIRKARCCRLNRPMEEATMWMRIVYKYLKAWVVITEATEVWRFDPKW